MAELPVLAPENYSCAVCLLSYPDIEPADISARQRAVTAEIRELTEEAGGARLTHRPAPDVWSPLEYLCHVRDVYVASTIRLYRARRESSPQIEPLFNDLRVLRFRHNEAQVSGVLHELDASLEGFLDEMAHVTDWNRSFSRQPGEERTSRWLARQTLHEAIHHLGDMRAGITTAA
ncbi:MAG TPA: DinB family protein [Frankiaceae bacterium]|nr:DinB family protein [Frankiaceae bacterium]